jgi:hypothetical protein
MTAAKRLSDAGFHAGELAVQRQAGVRDDAARLSGMLAATGLSGGVARFLAGRTFLVVTGRDGAGRLWTSPLAGSPGFLEVRSSGELVIHAAFPAGDPLHGIAAGQKAGLTAVEFATRRRVRVNGTLTVTGGALLVDVEQAYGNCPQYIQQRVLAPAPAEQAAGDVRTGTGLDPADVELVRSADTFFLGTVNPERGADASHKGGAPGFVRVDEHGGLRWPDYPGNNLFNSLGNLAVNSEAALLFFDFPAGRTLQLSGTAETDWGELGRSGDDGHTGRIVRFAPERVVAGHLLPARETAYEPYPRNPAIHG